MGRCRIDIKGNCDDEKICHCVNCYNNIESNIFEGAKFGDKFVTRGCTCIGISIPPIVVMFWREFEDNGRTIYSMIASEASEPLYYDKDGKNLESDSTGFIIPGDDGCGYIYDIVSKYQEPIDENKLDELADKLNPNNSHGDNYEVGQYFGFQDGFKAGYHKAMEE